MLGALFMPERVKTTAIVTDNNSNPQPDYKNADQITFSGSLFNNWY